MNQQLDFKLFNALFVEAEVPPEVPEAAVPEGYSLVGPVSGLRQSKQMFDAIKSGRKPQFTNLSSDELLQHLRGPRDEVKLLDSEILPDEDIWADQHGVKHHFFIIFDGKVSWWHTPKDSYNVLKNFGGIHTIGAGYGSREEIADILNLPFLYSDVTAEKLVTAIDSRKKPKETDLTEHKLLLEMAKDLFLIKAVWRPDWKKSKPIMRNYDADGVCDELEDTDPPFWVYIQTPFFGFAIRNRTGKGYDFKEDLKGSSIPDEIEDIIPSGTMSIEKIRKVLYEMEHITSLRY